MMTCVMKVWKHGRSSCHRVVSLSLFLRVVQMAAMGVV